MAGLAGRAQARGLSSEFRTCPIYLRVGWCKTKPDLAVPVVIAPSSGLYLTIRSLTFSRSWRYRCCYRRVRGGTHLGVGQLLASSQAPFPSSFWS